MLWISIYFPKMTARKSVFWTMNREEEWAQLLQHLRNMSSYPPTACCWVADKTIAEKQEWAGIFCSVLGPAWLLLSLMPVINLPATVLSPFPSKREIMLFLMDFTPHVLYSNKWSCLKLLCHHQHFWQYRQTAGMESNTSQSSQQRKRCELYYVLHYYQLDHPGS